MQKLVNFWGSFEDPTWEENYLQSSWSSHRTYGLLAYLACCFFMVFAGIFGDYSRTFFVGSANHLMVFRVLLFLLGLMTYFKFRKETNRPSSIEQYFDAMKLLAALIIVLLTLWTKGRSLTLLPGIMMTLSSYFILLPGRWRANLISSIALFIVFAFFSDAEATFGIKVHRYMSFMLLVVIFLISFFKKREETFSRVSYYQEQNLLQLTKTKDQILLTVAHDIRGPLSLVMARSQKLLKNIEKDPSLAVDVTESNVVQIDKVSKLLGELVNWAVAQNPEHELDINISCISTCVESAVTFVDDFAKDKNIVIQNATKPRQINHDRKLVTTCLRNLLINAIKFSPRGSEVHIESYEKDGEFILSVSDQGTGISDEMVSKLMEGNNNVSAIGTDGEKGTALGLRLVKKLLDRQNSSLKVENLDQGAKFSIIIPC